MLKNPLSKLPFCIFIFTACGEPEQDTRKNIFITVNSYEGFSIGGLYGADEICSSDALEAGLISVQEYQDRKYVAWLSSNGINAKDRIFSQTPDGEEYDYYTVNGKYVGTYYNIIHSELTNPINVYASGFTEEQLSYVWTGTNYLGNFVDGGDCLGWDGFENSNAVIGRSNAINSEWTDFKFNTLADCISYHKLYCFEK